MVGEEILASVGLGLLHKTGLFELKPPFLLKRKKEFPDCGTILKEKKTGGSFPPVLAAKYVALCRLTALAWAVWFCASATYVWAVVFIAYHEWRPWPKAAGETSSDTFVIMRSHTPVSFGLATGTYSISCWGLICVSVLLLFSLVIYYTSLVSSCREAESNLRRGLRRIRPVAAAAS